MLTAKTKVGTIICLANQRSKESLLLLRKQEEFFCPVCDGPVLLRLGEQRIFHFAHKRSNTCHDFFEPETIIHLEGKRQLYQWLVGQKIPCKLEYYDKRMKQRPDIMFQFQGKKYALEFQCSPLSEKVFIKRTKTYFDHDYIPLWIISANHLQPKKRNVISLTNFHYMFLRTTADSQGYIPAYCPKERRFLIVNSIIPYSIKNAFVHHTTYPLLTTLLPAILEPATYRNHLPFSNWKREMENYLQKMALHAGANRNPFLQELYKRNLNLFLLPAEIGLPVTHSLYIHTAPAIWQTYIFLDLIANKNPGDSISLNELSYHVNKRISRKEILIRQLPQLKEAHPLNPVIEYFHVLMSLGIMTRKSDTICQLNQQMMIPRSNREREEAKQVVHQKYQQFLLNK